MPKRDGGGSCRNECSWQWRPTSKKQVEAAEKNMLKGAGLDYEHHFIDISDGNHINTLKFGNFDDKDIIPLVLVHGFAAGAGFFVKNFRNLCEERNVYAIDILGFGRSSRPKFPDNPSVAEDLLIDAIEEWRSKMDLKKMFLLGHSFGGYLAGSYALKYPDHIQHLILADPWGFPIAPQPGDELDIPAWKVAVIKKISSYNPLTLLRAAGPLGPSLVRKLRRDIPRKYEILFGEGDNTVTDYLYHINAQDPSGEEAFTSISEFIGFSKNPLISRIQYLDKKMPLTILIGENSWMKNLFDFNLLLTELQDHKFVELHQIDGAGHHIFADNPSQFHYFVNTACQTCKTIETTV